jgi:hypothetical protein
MKDDRNTKYIAYLCASNYHIIISNEQTFFSAIQDLYVMLSCKFENQ